VRARISVYEKQFAYYRELAEKAIDQLGSDQLFIKDSEASNSIAVIMKHIAGNMLSRWTDIFNTDGEKTWRNRDQEFIDDFEDYEALMTYWIKGWDCLSNTLSSLTDEDLDKTIYIRNMGCSVHDAIVRQISHYPYHIGQIVHIARAKVGPSFISLSIPLGQSKDYNAKRFAQEKSMKHFIDDVSSDEN